MIPKGDPRNRSMEENQAEYNANMHAVQSAVAFTMNYDEKFASHKDLRVGINSAMVTDHAVATLLIEKGVFTREEYFAELVLSSRNEVELTTREASRKSGIPLERLSFL